MTVLQLIEMIFWLSFVFIMGLLFVIVQQNITSHNNELTEPGDLHLVAPESSWSCLNSYLMHQSSLTTALPPTEKGGEYHALFSIQYPAISPTPRGTLEVKTVLFALPIAIENLPGIRKLISKPGHFPCTVGTTKIIHY